MSASTAFANELLTALMVTQSYGATYIALHTADTGAGGGQTANEVAYTGYARKLVAPTDWTVTTNTFTNNAPIEFAEATAVTGTPSVTHFTIGTAATGAGKVLLRGKLATPQPVAVGTELRFKASTLNGSVDTAAPV